jgi:hypothetical protein
MTGPIAIVASTGATAWYASYTLTADGILYYDCCIDDVTTGSGPENAYIEIEIQPKGTGDTFDIAATPIGPNRVSGAITLPKGTVVQGLYANSDSITHYLTGFAIVFYPGNV